jgi:superfamily I DNA/RNA helicase
MDYNSQQQELFAWIREGRGSAFLRARAGTGKTTTLIAACGLMTGSIAFAAYNKKIATEISARLAKAGIGGNSTRAGTFHSFGYGALRRVFPDAKLDEKARDEAVIAEARVPEGLRSFALKLCSLAKNAALGLYGDVADDRRWWDIIEHHDLAGDLEDPAAAKDGLDCARRVLRASNDLAPQVINFDDMIYLPATRNMRVWANDWLLVDEAQDTNPARRALARKMLRPGGRAIFVGDDRQAIYGFTGADADAMDVIIRDFGCEVKPLTTTYRCPKAVVALANTIVADIEAHESAPEGAVRDLHEDQLLEEKLQAADAVLCRKTAPLISLAYKLIKAGTPCHVEGREIGQGLLKLAQRWKIKKVTALRDRLTEYREREVQKLLAKGRESAAEALSDRVETLLVLSEGCDDLECVTSKIAKMFADDAPTLTLSTVHKAKGREWGRVYVLGARQFMPSPWARQAWQAVQEQNLLYVAYTRAQRELVLVDVRVQS